MPTSTYHHPLEVSRGYGEPAGIRLLNELTGRGLYVVTTGQAADVVGALGISAGHTRKLLHELAVAGWVTRIKGGLYAANDRVTRLPEAHPYAIGTAMVRPAAVSHWAALAHWGLTEQIPQLVT